MDAAVVHRGWLLKRSGLLKSWQRRYFACVVQAGVPCLVYGPGPASPWAGSLPLSGATCGPLSRGEGHPEAACFYIHRDGATYVLGAASEADCLQWCTCITDLLRQANTATTPGRSQHTGGGSVSHAPPVVWSPAERRQQHQEEHTDSHEAALRDALHAAEEQRVRAERSCMAAEDERAALCQQLQVARHSAAHWEATARRLVARMAASEQARCAVEHQRDLLLLQARAVAGGAERCGGETTQEEPRPPEALLDDPADLPGWGLPLRPLANIE